MRRIVLAALFAGAATTLAAADVVVVYDVALGEQFEIKREIVDRVQQEFGEHAVYESTEELPASIAAEIAPGEPLPADAPVEDVPQKLGDLPTLGEGTHWVAVGNHLVEVTDDNTVVMVVYEALP
jgi:hypothetical protein